MRGWAFLLAMGVTVAGSQSDVNYDESAVPAYTLPDPLMLESGDRVTDPETWRGRRRSELLALFEEHVYGRAPGRPAGLRFDQRNLDENALGGRAIRREVSIHLASGTDAPRIDVLIYQPKRAGRVPAFVGLNFFGNHTIHPDPGITLSRSWMREAPELGVVDHRATERSRGERAHRWPVELIVERGYALVTAYYGDIDPDFDDGFANGVHALYPGTRKSDSWGSIAAWAWGLSRIADFLETDDAIDVHRIALMGHSRLGKAALWAGARDERFALVISNDSGCGGAALSRRAFGETVERINTQFPHWFCSRFHDYNGRESELPVDQHALLSLIAPRPLYVASAEEDRWADPHGEFLSLAHASPVYELLTGEGLGVDSMPEVEYPVSGRLGYHIRRGEHDVTRYDWERFLDFADRNLATREPASP